MLCEVAIVLQSKSINLFRDAATGPILSLTTNHMYLLCSLDSGMHPMIQMQELLLTVFVASVNSPSMEVPVSYIGHDSCEVLL